MTTILFIIKARPELQDYLRDKLKYRSDVELLFPESIEVEDLTPLAKRADAIVGWRPDDDMLEQAEKLKLFINPGAGVQHQIERFRRLNEKRKVALVNGHGNACFTAQHAVALLLALTNRVVTHHNWMLDGKWRMGDKEAASTPLKDRRVGLLGYGEVNKSVHRMLSGFDIEFSALKRSWYEDEVDACILVKRFGPDDMEEFLRWTDVLIIAVPHTSQTVGLIDKRQLELLGKSGMLVNMSRGVVVDEDALYETLKEQWIAGAAIDVWYEYQPEEDEQGLKFPYTRPFHKLDNIVLSPHRGASPFADLKRWDEVVENIRRLADGREDFVNLVDLEREY